MNRVQIKTKALMRIKKISWLDIKKAYWEDESSTPAEIAKRFGLPKRLIEVRAKNENWIVLREEIHLRAEERARQLMEDKLSQVKLRHAQIGKMLQAKGIGAIEDEKHPQTPKSAKDALKFTVEGVRLEREAEGLDQHKETNIINIVAQHQGVLDKYRQAAVDGEYL